jgi:hypothetical protein
VYQGPRCGVATVKSAGVDLDCAGADVDCAGADVDCAGADSIGDPLARMYRSRAGARSGAGASLDRRRYGPGDGERHTY